MNYDDLVSTRRTILFDLDNTIYSEIEYLNFVFEQMTSYIFGNSNIEAKDYLIHQFETCGRYNLIQKFIKKYNVNVSVEDLLNIYRTCDIKKKIRCYDWFYKFSKNYQNDDRQLRIITNGNVQQQKNKMQHILFPTDWERIEVVYANDYAPKPSAAGFYKLTGYETFIDPIYIGDTNIDKIFCDNLGIEFVDVKILQ